MFLNRAAAAGIIAGFGALAGCQMGPRSTPDASATVTPVNQADVAALEQTWRSSHPNTMVGHVIAVDPTKRIAEVSGIPNDQAQIGNVITILLDNRGSNSLQGVVFAKADGYIQLDYSPTAGGDRAPQNGDLAVLFPASPTVPPSDMTAGAADPAAGPGVIVTNPNPSDNTAAAPADNTGAAAPTTMPAADASGTAANPTGGAPAETPNATGNPMPESQPAAAAADTQPAATPTTQPAAADNTQSPPAATEPAPGPPSTNDAGTTGNTTTGAGAGNTTETPQAPASGDNNPPPPARDLNK